MNRENQQQTVSEFEVGWLAGFLEGEGSICLQIHQRESSRKQNLRVTPKVIFTNSDLGIIERCVSILDRLGIGKWVHHTNPRNNQNGLVKKASKEMHYIHVSGFKRIHRLLALFRGKLAGNKNVRCEVLFRFVDRRLKLSEQTRMQQNFHYDGVDVAAMLEFLKLTASPNYKHIAGMLNEYTQGTHSKKRVMMDSELDGNAERNA